MIEAVNAVVRIGNAGRNIVTGPGYNNTDVSLFKRIVIRERANIELRWEVFNVFNRANFALPNRQLNSSSVATITALQGDPRVMQFAVRFNF